MRHSQPLAFNNVKFYNPNQVTIAFPNALGLPSIYALQKPTLLKSEGEISLQSPSDSVSGSHDVVQIPKYVNVTADIHVV